jgi:TonB family protein
LELQPQIRASSFEVVLKKPVADPLTYEKPLPLDLIPFIERNDQYRSIGTAFALGQNRYVSAAHVFALAIDSQFGAPALRNASGEVYSVDRILKYSRHGDFVVFSLSKDPAPKGLPVNRAAKIDTAVFAVGNALGEGIVIRDGVFTSETPEEQDGQWKWIRFSAAASPGNSGGPLLDDAGNVVGIVLRKSANENLNYSLPIGIVLDAASDRAIFDQRELTSLPFMRGTRTYAYRDEFQLPLSWSDFVKAYDALVPRHFDLALMELKKAYADTQFLRGVGIDSILYAKESNFFDSRLIAQQADDTWSYQTPDCCSTPLPDDGFVSVGWVDGVSLLRLHRSNYASDDAFYRDSKAFMDIALKGLALKRAVGRDQIRITSLGSAQRESSFTDQFDRVWQECIWAMPYQDAYVVGFLLPTPEGYSGMIQVAPSANLRETESILRLMTDQFSVSYAGTSAQWQAFLKRSALLPKALRSLTLFPNPDVGIHTPRFETRVVNRVFPVGEQGQMGLIMGYVLEGGRLVWDVVSVSWTQDAAGKSTIGVWRYSRPPKSAKLELRTAYSDVAARLSPFDGQLLRDTADAYGMTQILDVPGTEKGQASSDLLYGVSVHLSGRNAYVDVKELLSLVVGNTHVLEHGIGGNTALYHEPAAQPRNSAAGFSASDFAVVASGKDDAPFGQDTRGRVMSADFRDYVLGGKVGGKSSADAKAAASQVDSESAKHAAALFDYWRTVPGVVHNRDLWPSFLELNHLPNTTAHRLSVVEAQAKLARTLDEGNPGPEWLQQARTLIEAYVKEREDIARSHGSELPADFSVRNSPCPKAAEKKSATDKPAIAPLTRSPEEFYPNAARRAQIEGAAIIAIQVDASGCGLKRGLVASSGSLDIDQAAMEFIDTAEFFPAQKQGTAVDGIYKTVVKFKFTE